MTLKVARVVQEKMAHPTVPGSKQYGMAYIAVLLLIAMMGISGAVTATVWEQSSQRERELELIHIGMQFQRAIAQYYENSPGIKQYPRSLEDLLRDPRHPGIRRYLRQIYLDPMTGAGTWGLVAAPQGGIMGVYSLGKGEPLKQSQFPSGLSSFEGKKRYQDWAFSYTPISTH